MEFRLSSDDTSLGLFFQNLGEVEYEQSSSRYFERYLRELEHLYPTDDSQRWHAQTRVRSQGKKLYADLIPEKLDQRLAPLVGKVASLQVLSEDAAIPWELLCFPTNDERVGILWAEAFQVTRFSQNVDGASTQIDVGRVAWVVGDGSLPAAAAERQAVEKVIGGRWEIVDIRSRYEDVVKNMASGDFGLWHFVGHGSAQGEDADSFRLILEDADLKPGDLQAAIGGIRKSAPLVFFNACEVGRAGYALTSVGGWGTELLRLGASGFIGPLWSVRDSRAALFPKAFYQHLIAGQSVGESVRLARSELRDDLPGDPTWLAYVAFAHASAALAKAEVASDSQEAEPISQSERQTVDEGLKATSPNGESILSGPQPKAQLQPTTDYPALEKRIPLQVEKRRLHNDGTQLMPVPGGVYPMGTEDENLPVYCGPRHSVRLSPFWIGKYPVTNKQYAVFLKNNPQMPTPAFWHDKDFNGLEQPVVGVNWHEALAYCEWAGLKLPSEAQWEAAAKGPSSRLFPWGDEDPTPEHANYGYQIGKTTPVGSYPAGASPFHTLDQAGNVWEWCADVWEPHAYRHRGSQELNPVAEGRQPMRVVRGGSWLNDSQESRADLRKGSSAEVRQNELGFRCVYTNLSGGEL